MEKTLLEVIDEMAVCGQLLVIGRVPRCEVSSDDDPDGKWQPAYFATAVDRSDDPAWAGWEVRGSSIAEVIAMAHTSTFEMLGEE